MMKKVAVTGGSGRSGYEVVNDLLEHGYEVTNIDIVPPPANKPAQNCPFRLCDMSDYGQTFAALHGFDAVVHLAADPRPDDDYFTGAQRFHNNTLGVYNVFNAAAAMGMERVVWASSETIYGLPFDKVIPEYLPLDEELTYQPQTSYAISKVISEQMAEEFHKLTGIPFIGLQFSNILYPHVYETFPKVWEDPKLRFFNLWSYVDYRDVCQSVRAGLETNFSGADNFIIVSKETVMNRPTAELVAEYFPTVSLKDGHGEYQSLMSWEKAATMIGYDPQHSWREFISLDGEKIS